MSGLLISSCFWWRKTAFPTSAEEATTCKYPLSNGKIHVSSLVWKNQQQCITDQNHRSNRIAPVTKIALHHDGQDQKMGLPKIKFTVGSENIRSKIVPFTKLSDLNLILIVTSNNKLPVFN